MSTKVNINICEIVVSKNLNFDINFVALGYVVLKIQALMCAIFKHGEYMNVGESRNIFEIAAHKSMQIHSNNGST